MREQISGAGQDTLFLTEDWHESMYLIGLSGLYDNESMYLIGLSGLYDYESMYLIGLSGLYDNDGQNASWPCQVSSVFS